MDIRPAAPTDCPQIAAIWNPIIRDTIVTFNSVEKTPEDLVEMLADKARAGHAFLVAVEHDDILGFATYGQFRGGIGYAHTMEHTIILAPNARGRGIGRALMMQVEDHARARGAHSMFAGICADNDAAVLFHKSVGYSEAAHLPQVGRKFNRWLDLVLLQKML